MKNGNKVMAYLLAGAFGLCAYLFIAAATQAANPQTGETEFKEYCAECHADGGNSIKPTKTLSRADREKNGIRTAEDIIKIMRKPGEGMVLFDEKTLPEAEAGRIAEYILNTFK
jgi:cytochrome c6